MIRKIEQFVWNGKPVVNQIIITTDNQDYLISYGKTVASKGASGVFLSPDWNYSKTTAKYVSRFLGLSTKDIAKHIKSGDYKLVQEIIIE